MSTGTGDFSSQSSYISCPSSILPQALMTKLQKFVGIQQLNYLRATQKEAVECVSREGENGWRVQSILTGRLPFATQHPQGLTSFAHSPMSMIKEQVHGVIHMHLLSNFVLSCTPMPSSQPKRLHAL
jgi:hypothetical protein